MNLNTVIFPMPKEAEIIFNVLGDASHEINLVGGCIRDYFMDRPIKDYDFCTSASPEQVKELFSQKYEVIDTGLKHGTVTVVINKIPFEITSYRIDKYDNENTLNHRTPSEVIFSSDKQKVNLYNDLSRRDFTINAMAFDGEKFIDPFDGRADKAKGVLKCVGNPTMRFKEDALRILRGIRFSVTHNLRIETGTLRAMFAQKKLLCCISKERITKELIEILNHPIDLKGKHQILEDVLDELYPEYFEFFYLKTLNRQVYERVLKVFKTNTPAYFKLAFLLRCVLEDVEYSSDCFSVKKEENNREKLLTSLIKEFCQKQLKCTNDFTKKVIKIHDVGNFFYDNINLIKSSFYSRIWTGDRLFYPAGVLLHALGKDAAELNFWTVLYISNIVDDKSILKRTNALLRTMGTMISDPENYPYMFEHMRIDGDDLELMGIKGKEIKKCFEELMGKLLMREILNDRESLFYEAVRFKKSKTLELPPGSKVTIEKNS